MRGKKSGHVIRGEGGTLIKTPEPLKNALVARFVIKVVPRVVHLVVHRENRV